MINPERKNGKRKLVPSEVQEYFLGLALYILHMMFRFPNVCVCFLWLFLMQEGFKSVVAGLRKAKGSEEPVCKNKTQSRESFCLEHVLQCNLASRKILHRRKVGFWR